VTRLWVGQLRNCSLVSGKSSKFISLSECLHWHWGSSYLLFNAYWHVFFLGTEWVGCEADQSPPSGVKVKEWIYTFTPLYAFVISQGHLYLLRDVGCEDEKRKDVAQIWAQVLVFGISNVRWVSYTNIVLNGTYSHWKIVLLEPMCFACLYTGYEGSRRKGRKRQKRNYRCHQWLRHELKDLKYCQLIMNSKDIQRQSLSSQISHLALLTR